MKHKLSVIIPTYNEAKNLPQCLDSVRWADEILVVDSFSTDKTIDIAKQYSARVLQHEYKSHAAQRNWAIQNAQHDWVLLLDADERLTLELQQEIQELLNQDPPCSAYWIKRVNFYLGYQIRYSGWGNDYIGRLFKRGYAHIEEGGFHGDLVTDGKHGKLKNSLEHYTYQSSDEIFDKIKTYAKGGAELMHQQGKQSSYFKIVSRTLWAFGYNYIIRWGFVDGVPGLMVCTQSAYYVFMKYAILWKLNQSK